MHYLGRCSPACFFLVLMLAAAAPAHAYIERVSVASDGSEAVGGHSEDASISDDLRYVSFYSAADNLVAGDTNGAGDIFVRDRREGTTSLVSVSTSGVQANNISWVTNSAMSADGRYVVFTSPADNLVPGDTNAEYDVFVRDRQEGTTTRVSVSSSGVQGNDSSQNPRISADGRYVAFQSLAANLVAGDGNGVRDVFVHDMQTGTTTRVSVDSSGGEGNLDSSIPSISSDGRYVAFQSSATNLVAGDGNGVRDAFVHDTQTGETTRVSVTSSGAQATGGDTSVPRISRDGRYVAFHSDATNLAPSDTNGAMDVFLHDRQTGETTRVSVTSSGGQASGGGSFDAAMSTGAQHVVFGAEATNLVANDTNGKTDIFLRDRNTGETTRVSVNDSGAQVDGWSDYPVISGNGRYIAFDSDAGTLVSGDGNGNYDVFLVDRGFDYSFTKTADPVDPTTESAVTYTVSFSNDGPNDVSSLIISDPLPTGVSYESHEASHGSYDPSGGEWSVGALAVGETAELSIVVKATQAGTITNTARIVHSNPEAYGATTAEAVIEAGQGRLLTVTVLPEDGGVVTGTGIDCPGDCSEYYADGADAVLTAQASGDHVFGAWSGDASGAGSTLTISMTADKSVTATFGLPQTHTINISAGDAAPAYRILSLPLQPTDAARSGFYGLDLGEYDTRMWRIGRWDPSTGSYDEYPFGYTPTPGWAAWFICREGAVWNLSGVETPEVEGPHGLMGCMVDIASGWNQVGNPFPQSVDAADLWVREDGGGWLQLGGASNSATQPVFWVWSSGEYGSAESLAAAQGGWIKKLTSGGGQVFFPSGSSTGGTTSSTSGPGTSSSSSSSGGAADVLREAPAGLERPPAPPRALTIAPESSSGGGCFVLEAVE